MSNQWFRLYAEFATDAKVQMLSEANQRRYIMLLCIRCNGEVTLQDDEIAFQLRVTLEEWLSTKQVLQAKKLIDENSSPSAWDKRQYVSDSSAARVANHRKKKKEASNADVTLQKRPSNALDTDTDTDTEEAKEHALTCIANSPPGEPADLPDELAKRRKKTLPPCPIARIAELWDERLPELASPIVWTDARKTAVSTRWREMAVFHKWEDQTQGVEWFRRTFDAIRGSPFLMGKVQPRNRDQKPFALTLDWMFGPKNFLKVVEGKYHEVG